MTSSYPARLSVCSSRRTFDFWSSTMRILAARGSIDGSMILFGKCQGHVQRVHEFADLDRLRQIAEEPGVQPSLDVARHGVGAERNHGNVRRRRVVAENSQRLDSADAGKVDVHQD